MENFAGMTFIVFSAFYDSIDILILNLPEDETVLNLEYCSFDLVWELGFLTWNYHLSK